VFSSNRQEQRSPWKILQSLGFSINEKLDLFTTEFVKRNEENARKSKNSIEKSPERNEVVSR